MLCYFCQDRSLDAAKSLEIEGKPPSSANTVFATSRPIKHVILSRLPPGALGGHCVGTLDAWRWIRVRWADCATLHRLASLQTAHVISLDAVWTIRFPDVFTPFVEEYCWLAYWDTAPGP
jgi:hypothetical protein